MAAVASSGAQVITVAMRRVEKGQQGIVGHIPSHMRLLPNTSGARTAEEAVRLARLARAAGCGDWIKIEVISDTRHLLPDGYETAKATEILTKATDDAKAVSDEAEERAASLKQAANEYCPDLYVARACADAGAAAVMPLGAPIGTNRGLRTREMIGILIEEIDLPIVVDAGIGLPSHACEAMEMGASACLVNTAIAVAGDPVAMAVAFRQAVEAGRMAYEAGLGLQTDSFVAEASSPLTAFLND